MLAINYNNIVLKYKENLLFLRLIIFLNKKSNKKFALFFIFEYNNIVIREEALFSYDCQVFPDIWDHYYHLRESIYHCLVIIAYLQRFVYLG